MSRTPTNTLRRYIAGNLLLSAVPSQIPGTDPINRELAVVVEPTTGRSAAHGIGIRWPVLCLTVRHRGQAKRERPICMLASSEWTGQIAKGSRRVCCLPPAGEILSSRFDRANHERPFPLFS